MSMYPAIERGQRFRTERGPVTVLEARKEGAIVLVHNELRKLFMPIAQLYPRAAKEEPKATAAPPVASPVRTVSPAPSPRPAQVVRATLSTERRTIEALRFGLVPLEAIEELTLGFDDLAAWTASRLPHENDGAPQLSEIHGKFGTGKSHTSAVVRHVARKHGYLTARVEVDGKAVSLSDPGGLLFHLWSTLSGADLHSSTPLLDVYLKAIDRGFPPPHIAPRGIDRIHDNYQTIRLLSQRGLIDTHGYAIDALLSCSNEFTAYEVRKQIWEEPSVSGSEVDLKPMIGKRVDDRPHDFVESLVGHTVLATLAGYRGLVVTIDEFEVEITQLAPRMRERALAVLRLLTEYLEGATSYRGVPISIFIANAGADGHVGDQIVNWMVEQTGGDSYGLNPLSKEERAELARRIHAIYQSAYGLRVNFDPRVVATVERGLDQDLHDSGLTRAFVKHYVAMLDRLHGPPTAS